MAKTTKDGAEPRVVALAQQLGTVLGRAQAKADKLLKQVNESTAAAKKLAAPKLRSVGESAAKVVAAVKPKPKAKAKAAPASPKRVREGGKKVAPAKVKARSGGAVDAPGKRHRKPPPQEKFSRGMTEPKVRQMGQKGIKGRMQRGGSGS